MGDQSQLHAPDVPHPFPEPAPRMQGPPMPAMHPAQQGGVPGPGMVMVQPGQMMPANAPRGLYFPLWIIEPFSCHVARLDI